MNATRTARPTVPAPQPPDAADAWYAPDVRAQYESYPELSGGDGDRLLRLIGNTAILSAGE